MRFRFTLAVLLVSGTVAAFGAREDVSKFESDFQTLEESFICVDGCGMPLVECSNDTAEAMRGQIRDYLNAGWDQGAIRREMVSLYGSQVLREPPKTGFSLLVWVLPYLGIALGFVFLGWVLKRWTTGPADRSSVNASKTGPRSAAGDVFGDIVDAERLTGNWGE